MVLASSTASMFTSLRRFQSVMPILTDEGLACSSATHGLAAAATAPAPSLTALRLDRIIRVLLLKHHVPAEHEKQGLCDESGSYIISSDPWTTHGSRKHHRPFSRDPQ